MNNFTLHILFVILFSFLQWNSYAQESINITGKDISGDGGTVSYSVGQIEFHSLTDGNHSITEGVQQPYEISIIGINNALNIQLSMKIFPNPAENNLYLSVEVESLDGYSYKLSDLEGHLLKEKLILESNSTIDLFDYASSTYFLSIFLLDQKIKTFKIIKK